MKPNDVVLIYADQNKKDIGVLQDYSFDMCYGDSENNFECRVQKYNPAVNGDTPIRDDFILYVEFTEYGGIIDKKEVNTKTGEIIFSGRSWHGILNSYVIEPPEYYSHRSYQGEANAIISQIISDIGMSSWFTVDNEDSGIQIPCTKVRYEAAYDFIMRMLLQVDAKLAMWYQRHDVYDGKVHLRAVQRVNTGAFDDFDTSQIPFKAGITYNKVNDLICLGGGEGRERAVIHLYTDKNGGLLPYCRKDANWDGDYYTSLTKLASSTNQEDQANYAKIMSNMQTGIGKHTMIFDYPNAETRINYVPVTHEPSKWRYDYTNYYYLNSANGSIRYEKIEKTYKDEYVLTDVLYGGAPPNWEYEYPSYYKKEKNSSTELEQLEQLDPVEYYEYAPSNGLQSVDANEWKGFFELDSYDREEYAAKYGMYYERTGNTYNVAAPEHVQGYFVYNNGGNPPPDWDTNYGNYYYLHNTGTSTEYRPVPGYAVTEYELLTMQPTDWTSNYGGYYFKAAQKVTQNKKVTIKKGQYYTVSQGISAKLIEKTSKKTENGQTVIYLCPIFKTNTFYRQVTKYVAPTYVQGRYYYYQDAYVAPTFVAGKYYKKVKNLQYPYPAWQKQGNGPNDFGGYYEKFTNVEQVPVFNKKTVYEERNDRYADLCELGVKKLKELTDTDTLDIALELETSLDVGDMVGGTDIETNIRVVKPILRKIIKIKKGLLSVDYEVD